MKQSLKSYWKEERDREPPATSDLRPKFQQWPKALTGIQMSHEGHSKKTIWAIRAAFQGLQ